MSEVKTAAAWHDPRQPFSAAYLLTYGDPQYGDKVTIVNRSEQDVIAGLSLLAKSREVCEWYMSECRHGVYDHCPSTCDAEPQMQRPAFCPSCGRRVEVKE